LFCSRLLSSGKICLKEMWRRPEKTEEEKTQKISDPSMAGRGEEAVWTLRHTDGRAQSRRPTVLKFFNYLRMEPAMYDELVQRVGSNG